MRSVNEGFWNRHIVVCITRCLCEEQYSLTFQLVSGNFRVQAAPADRWSLTAMETFRPIPEPEKQKPSSPEVGAGPLGLPPPAEQPKPHQESSANPPGNKK